MTRLIRAVIHSSALRANLAAVKRCAPRARASIAGRVSMDMVALDVTDLPPVKVGASVVLWGEGLSAETVAPYAEGVPYELLCGVSKRVALELE